MSNSTLNWSGESRPDRALPIPSNLFAGTRGPRRARILVVGEAYGQSESEQNMPFVGASGKLLDDLLGEAGIDPAECLFTNLINTKPSGNDMRAFLLPHAKETPALKGLHPNAQLVAGIQKLDALIDAIHPTAIIACGNWPLWWLTDVATCKTAKGHKLPVGIGNWAGSQLRLTASPYRVACEIPVLPIYHPAAILRQHPWRVITACDLNRVARHMTGVYSWHAPSDETLILRPSPARLRDLLHMWRNQSVTCDLETSRQRIHIVGLGMGKVATAIPFFDLKADGSSTPVYSRSEFAEIYHLLFNFFRAPTTRLTGQNFLYDLQYINRYFMSRPHVTHDTMIAQHILFSALRGFKGLDSLSRFYCCHHLYWKDERKESTTTEDLDRALRYNCRDILATTEVAEAQRDALDRAKRSHLFAQRMEVFPVVRDMMLRGIATNERLRETQLAEILHQISNVTRWLESVLPKSLIPVVGKNAADWHASPQQLADILYHKLGLQGGWNPETSGYSTDKEILAKISKRYLHISGFLSALIVLRSLRTISTGILSAPLGFDGRMHTSYNLAGPTTFRLASSADAFGSGDNLQNVLRAREPMELTDQDIV